MWCHLLHVAWKVPCDMCGNEFPTKETFWGFNNLKYFVLGQKSPSFYRSILSHLSRNKTWRQQIKQSSPNVLFSIHVLQLFIGDISIPRSYKGGYNIPLLCPIAPFLFSVSGIFPHVKARRHPNHMPKSPPLAHFNVTKQQLYLRLLTLFLCLNRDALLKKSEPLSHRR